MKKLFAHRAPIWIPTLIFLSLSLTTLAWAGAHTGAKKPKPEIKLDAARRTDITGTVLVTGANRGIGLELARNYAERGWTVIATARKPEKADALNAIAAKNDNVTVVQMDLLDLDGIDALAARLKDVPIDVLLNNAAMLGEPNDQTLGNLDYDLMKRVLNVNVVGTMKMVEAFVPHVEKSDQKKIVAITSTQGSISSIRNPGLVFYNTSKTALNMVMKSNSRALKKQGITVALVSPGAVDTDMMNLALDRAGVSFKLLTPQASAEAVINVIDQYGLDMTGTFMSHTGTEIPW
jgi:NAD(P)-dependent dehydrogenase (short-subunit alcohol dehydrogenase family)